MICITVLLKLKLILFLKGELCFRCLIFLSQTAYIFGFYTVDYTCVICMRAVSLKIPISDLCVCMCILLNKMGDAKIPHLLLKDLAFFIMIQP